jgi:hypothetical protein
MQRQENFGTFQKSQNNIVGTMQSCIMILIEKASVDFGATDLTWTTYRFLKDECYERVLDILLEFDGWALEFFFEVESIFLAHIDVHSDISDRAYGGKMICD